MVRNFRHIALNILAISPFALVGCANGGAMDMENHTMQFSYTTNGGADGSINKYGNNEVSVSGDVLRIQIGDSDESRNINGVGIYELKLLGENMDSATQLAELLCSPKDPNSDWPTPNLYISKCSDGMRSSFARDFSRETGNKIFKLVNSLTNAGVQDGLKIVKLDLSLVSIDRVKDGFLVSVRFDNSGDYPIKFQTPDKWDSRIGKDSLGISSSRPGVSDSEFGFGLAGQVLENPDQFPDREVNLAPHSSVTLKMKTTSVDKFSAGDYKFDAGAFMDIKVTGIQSSPCRYTHRGSRWAPARKLVYFQ
jgi:hypothetical protein